MSDLAHQSAPRWRCFARDCPAFYTGDRLPEGWGRSTDAYPEERLHACPEHLAELRRELGLSGEQPQDA
jgi:hypothetical protein